MQAPTQHRRNQGACLECVKRKRKCDEKQPACYLCRRHNRLCQPRTFKGWEQAAGRRPKKPRNHPDGVPSRYCPATSPKGALAPIYGRSDDSVASHLLTPSSAAPSLTSTAHSTEIALDSPAGEHQVNHSPGPRVLANSSVQSTESFSAAAVVEWLTQNDLASASPARHCETYAQEETQSPSVVHTECEIILPQGLVGKTREEVGAVHGKPDTRLTLWPNTALSFPNDVMDSPLNRYLWSHFVAQGTKMFLCWDPHAVQGGFYDPFTKVLASMALRFKPLRLAAMGLSAFLQSTKTQEPAFRSAYSNLGLLSSEALCSQRSKPATDTHSLLQTIATAILLFLIDSQGSTNMLQLARSAAAYMLSPEMGVHVVEDEYFEVVMHLLRWCDICTQCSLLQSVQMSHDSVHRSIEFQEQEQQASLSRTFENWVIHPLYTFSTRWINPLLRLGRLMRLRMVVEESAPLSPGGSIAEQINKLEEDILLARNADLKACTSFRNDLPDLLHLNEAIHSATVLLFYTRLRDLPWSNPFVRRHVGIICDEIDQISPESPTSNNILFPLYTAGCEAVDLATRTQIVNRVRRLPITGYWFNQETKLVSSLRHVWSVRDADPGALWMEWSKQLLSEHIDCVPV
ncbi:hypothetical protein PV04_09728 [Phialophora macrospora]|uniref:Zn(2)-C6 fungal-type domain-containing protein n=1 Tax=Phialophora macrospora TaxID=1851006 RepID=A0A0D2CHX2_9EURO|nr:hypothetical protein PV04_09728 [Phialophora macrospora]